MKSSTGPSSWETFSQFSARLTADDRQTPMLQLSDLYQFDMRKLLLVIGLHHMFPWLQLIDGGVAAAAEMS